jgi:RNA recognition motif-containing protein
MMRGTDILEYPAIFIGGLPPSCTWQSLYEYLRKYGEIKSLILPEYKQGRRIKGYAKARFKTFKSVDSILACAEHVVQGVRVGISLWKNKALYRPILHDLRSRIVHVKYQYPFTKEQLNDYFSWYGTIELVQIPHDYMTGKPKPFSYIVFTSEKSAALVTQNSVHIHLGNHMVCDMSKRIHFGFSHSNDGWFGSAQITQEISEVVEKASQKFEKQLVERMQRTTFKNIGAEQHLDVLTNLSKSKNSSAKCFDIITTNFELKPTSKYYHQSFQRINLRSHQSSGANIEFRYRKGTIVQQN